MVWLLSALGLWIVVSPILLLSAQSIRWNCLIAGLLVMLVGSWLQGTRLWPKFFAMVVGGWFLASSSIQRLQLDGLQDVNAVITGILVIVGGLAAARCDARPATSGSGP